MPETNPDLDNVDNDDLDIFDRLDRHHGIVIEPRDRTRLIGKGGLANVYRGKVRSLKDRKAGVKISRDAIADEPELFKKELEGLDRLLQGPLGSSPNVVSMLTAPILEQDHDDLTYLVTVWELADRSLHDLQRTQFPKGLSREHALHFYEDAARGLDDMAREGEVHRDVKPGNILLFGNRAKLADVGLMRVLANRTEKTTAIRGTLETIPPESLDQTNLVVSPTFDSYSLGVSYAISRRGRPLFSDNIGSSTLVDVAMITRLLALKREFHRVDLSGLDPDEQDLIRKLCHPDPKQRPTGNLADLIRRLSVVTVTVQSASFNRDPQGSASQPATGPKPPVKQLSAVDQAKQDAKRLIGEKNYERAIEELDKVEAKLRDMQWNALRLQAVTARNDRDHAHAQSVAQQYDYAQAVQILEQCDPKLRDEGLLNQLRTKRDRKQTLAAELTRAAIENDFMWHLPMAEELLLLDPTDDGAREMRDLLAQRPQLKQEFTLSCGMKLKLVLPGTYWRGDNDGPDHVKPAHQVRISQPFWMGIYPVTQGEWQKVMGSNPSKFTGNDRRPVEQVSWDDTRGFFERVMKSDAAILRDLGVSGYEFRLPTEAQYEYVMRAGSTTRFWWGDDENQASEFAWFSGNSNSTTQPVGTKQANPWGFYDMAGNVWQWTWDWWDDKAYQRFAGKLAVDPVNSVTGSNRCLRGGSWGNSDLGYLRSACRDGNAPDFRYDFLGFRLAAVPAFK